MIRQEGENNTNEQEQQELRWTKFVKQWAAAGNTGECLVVGDTNLDILKWDNPNVGQDNMVDRVKDEISTKNFHQVVQGPTRFWEGTKPSLIDQCWGNNVQKISNVKNFTRGTADHNVIALTYRLKGNVMNSLETKGRDRRNYSEEEFKRQIALQDWRDIFEEQNVDIAVYKFETKFLKVLDTMAPMKKFQPRGRRSDWISVDTKRRMKERDVMRDNAVRSSQLEEWKEYRALRNLCNRLVKKDRQENLEKHLKNLHDKKDSKGLYNLVKKKMGWKKTGAPEIFVVNGQKISNPRKMAMIQMETFRNKVSNLISLLPLK